MVVTAPDIVEREVFGVTYERYALQKLFARSVKKWRLRTVLEMPASGAKAMPSLYSIGLALADCQITLVEADPEALILWADLGLGEQLTCLTAVQAGEAIHSGSRFDLCWNFMVLPTEVNPGTLLQQMIEASRDWVMVVHVNRYNVGFNMHRTVHRIYKIPWTHGDLRFFSPWATCRRLRQAGLKEVGWGVVDCPPWPDSPGFRDLRLHRQNPVRRRWLSPYVEHVRDGSFPAWMKWIYPLERFPFPPLLKLPYAHLYYAYGRVAHEIGI